MIAQIWAHKMENLAKTEDEARTETLSEMVTTFLSIKLGINTQKVALERAALHLKEKAGTRCPECALAS